ncbi:MAG: four-carbon acid sugar kinase family protein, partial [Micromonosporaceae bacterium]
MLRDSLPAASEVFAALPGARPDDDALRASIRGMRAADGLLLGVLDDDPTGSQAVHDIQVVTVLEENAYEAALGGTAATCFVLTNTRSLNEKDAARLNTLAAGGLIAVAQRRGARIQLISRSDSTLRGHVMAEVEALHAVRRQMLGGGFDGVLLVPAFLEAGRLTAADIHWARIGPGLVAVGETEYARDSTFGYAASDLRDFVAEKSGGAIGPDDVRSISLPDIRLGGPSRVAGLLADVHEATWVIVNATEYSDLETVAYGVLLAERAGKSFLFRTGPSFVRALSGLGPKAPLRGEEIVPAGRRGGHGLIVVGSHVSNTSRQVAALRARGGTIDIELDVPSIMSGADGVVAAAAQQAAGALSRSDVLLYTSRTFVPGRDRADSLDIARRVSAALSRTVREALA